MHADRRPLPLLVSILLAACGGAGGGDGESTGTSAASDTGPGTGGDEDLVPCEPGADDCGDDLCAGRPRAGFYCRPLCPEGAAEGDACGRAGVCLPGDDVFGDGSLACFELSDCDFMTGAGCDTAAGETCAVIDADPLRTACEPHAPGAPGATCGPGGILGCDPGLACLGTDLDGGDPGRCTAWCVPGDPLPAGCPSCIPVTDQIGTCAECSILADDCPQGEQCQPVQELAGGVCVGFGPGGEGDPCTVADATASCQPGLLCLEVADDVFQCVATCDPANPACSDPNKTCNDVGILSPDLPDGILGLCIEQDVMWCTPGGMPDGCANDQMCLAVDPDVGVCADTCDPTTGLAACAGNYACLPAVDGAPFLDPFAVGNGACGEGCAADADCPGQARCLLLAGLEAGGVCGAACAPADPNACGPGQTCVPLANDPQNGACVPGGTSCDGSDPTSCGAGSTCVALDAAPGEGACLPACFEQDPSACNGVGGTCQVRTDAAFHTGACVGQPTACDPVAQSGCDPGQSCRVLGGGPLGGVAYTCEDAGPLAGGDDCSADAAACGPGLACVGDVCRAYCDPMGAPCAMGTCTDISASLYLPADTLGACM